MLDFTSFYAQLASNKLHKWLESLPAQLATWSKDALHGDFKQWQKVIANLPTTKSSLTELKSAVQFGHTDDISSGEAQQIRYLLQQLKPWRKGPFSIHGIDIDTEWRSDFKWDRVLPHIAPLHNRFVLDVGCGSGYHLWRMRGEGAEFVVGIDPSQLFYAQFQAIKHFNPDPAQLKHFS